jgi:hypothetical protein
VVHSEYGRDHYGPGMASALDRLLAEARAVRQYEVFSGRTTRPGDGWWPSEEDAAELCGLLAETTMDQREAFRRGLTGQQCRILVEYGAEAVLWAARERSRARLRLALIARALGTGDEDWRDVLLGLARYHYAAHRLGMRPSELFDEAAAYAHPDRAEWFALFGRRTDITPESWDGIPTLLRDLRRERWRTPWRRRRRRA